MRLFGLIGKTLKHSFSKDFFAEKFERDAVTDCRYDNFELPSINELPGLLARFPELAGFNITIPYKEAVLSYLHQASEIVQATAACINWRSIVQGMMPVNSSRTLTIITLVHRLIWVRTNLAHQR